MSKSDDVATYFPFRYFFIKLILEFSCLLLQPLSQLSRLLLPLSSLLVQPLSEVVIVTQQEQEDLLDVVLIINLSFPLPLPLPHLNSLAGVDDLLLGLLVVRSHLPLSGGGECWSVVTMLKYSCDMSLSLSLSLCVVMSVIPTRR